MVGLIVNLKPLRVQEIQDEFQRNRDIVNQRVKISRKVRDRIQQDPMSDKRNKFQID